MGSGSPGRAPPPQATTCAAGERYIGKSLTLETALPALVSATRKATLARTVEVASSAKRTRNDVAYGRIPPGAEPFMAGTGSDETTRIS